MLVNTVALPSAALKLRASLAPCTANLPTETIPISTKIP